jgi:glycosyltransferase involved in cell wall biosynthesis
LFLAHCTREKGLFAAAQAVLAANQILSARQSPVRMKLFAAGSFVINEEKTEFDQLLKNPEFNHTVNYLGFVSGAEKERVLREADLFCFPTRYIGENQPVNLIEAMAFGLPIVTTRWRSLPEMLPPNYPGLVDSQSPEQIAAALILLMNERSGETARMPSGKPGQCLSQLGDRRAGLAAGGAKFPNRNPAQNLIQAASPNRCPPSPANEWSVDSMYFPSSAFVSFALLCGHFNAGFRDKALRNCRRQLFWFR